MTRNRRPGPSVRVRVREYVGAEVRRHEDRVITEEPLEIRWAGPGEEPSRLWVTMRTPGHDFELAAGYLGSLGVRGIHTLAYCTDTELSDEEEFNVVTARLTTPRPDSVTPATTAASSACGVCGSASIADALAAGPGPGCDARPGWSADPDVVRRLPQALRTAQRLFEETGGVHAAGLFDETGRLLVVREDVGRHNAVDKVIGHRLLNQQATAVPYLCVSGRIGLELIQKAVAAGVGAIAGVGAPTSLSVRLAREAGVEIFGFTRPDRCVGY